MANDDDVIRLDDDETSASTTQESVEKSKEDSKEDKKKRLIKFGAIGGGAFLALLIIVVLIVILSSGEEEPPLDDNVDEIVSRISEKKPISEIEIEQMIQKAALLYQRGDKIEALNLYGNISTFSEGLSLFNLGVAMMEERSYKEAIKTFQKAIDIDEDRVFSALNAAVCALYLNDKELSDYYIELAASNLSHINNLALYSYIYSIIEYFRGNYFEALTPLSNQTSNYYQDEQNYMLANIYLKFNQNYKAITHLERVNNSNNDLALGLLYARVGEYNLALNNLIRHIDLAQDKIRGYKALALVDMKIGNFADTSSILENLIKSDEERALEIYPIGVKLTDTLFDINLAQKKFMNDYNIDSKDAYKVLFYFSPYRVFDAKEALNFIQKGGVNILLEEIDEAKDILLRGTTISRVNLNIAEAIKESLEHKVRDTNKLLRDVIEQHPNHSILHYNLGLSYAHLGDLDSAYRHFVRSYHLNSKDILAGIFAMISAKASGRDYGRIFDGVSSEIGEYDGDELELSFFIALIGFFQNNVSTSVEWLDRDKRGRPVYLALDLLISHYLKDEIRYPRSVEKLKELFPNDVVVNLFEIISKNFQKDPKDIAEISAPFFRNNNNLEMDSIYYGASIAREIYIKFGYIVGAIHYIKEHLEDKILTENRDVRGVMQSLALTYIYTKDFENSFTLYNELIDRFKEVDSNTLFFAAVAAIGAGHHSNAVALLELSKLTDRSNNESRYALGLLYQEAKNLRGASIEYSAIGNIRFQSNYFDFYIK